MSCNNNVPGSFRDPSGFLFFKEGTLYRQINLEYKENYDYFINSGLYSELSGSGLLISHQEADISHRKSDNAYKVIKPEPVSFISYPYEWCFSQLKDAALTTLKIQKKALEHGMILKDASAYNIQFKNSKPIFVDTLSLEKYDEKQPWVAYRQFCQHFLAPLALMNYTDIRLNQLFRIFIDGIPLDLTSSLLPLRTRLIPSLFLHIYLHARSQRYFADKPLNKTAHKINRLSLQALVESLESAVKKLTYKSQHTEWADYYKDTNYSSEALEHKKDLVVEFVDMIKPELIWDLGANVGLFSRIVADQAKQIVSFDIDPNAVEENYLTCIQKGTTNILPLLLDFTNPSPGIGWKNQERASIFERGPADVALALAVIHHLAISNNLPFNKIADFFNAICDFLIIEFIPKSDSQVQRLLSSREDIFTDYTQQAFENEFKKYFTFQKSIKIKDSKRILYLMKRKLT